MKVFPITPEDAVKAKILTIPDYYIEVFNDLIIKNLKGKVSRIYYKDVICSLENKSKELGLPYKEDIINGNYIEKIYNNIGWQVITDTPAYNENYPGYYEFSIR